MKINVISDGERGLGRGAGEVINLYIMYLAMQVSLFVGTHRTH